MKSLNFKATQDQHGLRVTKRLLLKVQERTQKCAHCSLVLLFQIPCQNM